MAASPNKNIRNLALLFFGLLLFLTWLLGHRGLNDPDEGRYSNIALNFLKPGADLWEPRMSGYAHYDKPPLIYWTTALSFKFFGQTETAARLPSALGALMAVIGVGWAGLRLYGKQVAWWAMLVCGTLGQIWFLARFLTPDMFLAGWCTLAIAAWAEARHRKGDWRFWSLSLLFWTLAWWTKATPALIPLLGLTIGVLVVKDAEGKRALRPLFLLLGILVLGSVWYVRMIHEHGELVDFFFVREMKGRVTGHVEGRKGPIYYYLVLSLIAWLPWWPMALRSVVGRCLRKWPTGREIAAALGVEGWIAIVGVVIFSCISSKLPAYTVPMAPWVALFFARCIVSLQTSLPPEKFRRWAITSGVVWPAILVAALPFVPKTPAILVTAFPSVPKNESAFRFNSSLREVASILKEKGADVVYLDRYFSTMEFYFGNKTFYVLNDPLFHVKFHQRPDDDGIDAQLGEPHFYFPKTWGESLEKHRNENIWAVHYFTESPSAFTPFLNPTNAADKIVVGNFVLVRIPAGATETKSLNPQKS